VLYDLAFLMMDLWRRHLRVHANIVFNRYLERTVDLGGLPLLPLFLSCRAAVRAKTSAATAKVQSVSDRAGELLTAVGEYLVLAESLLSGASPLLVAIGGFSGSGKSTLARALASTIGAPPGALILRSDVIRKHQFGVEPLTHLGPDAYTASVNERVYGIIAERAKIALSAGQTVIADAVYGSASTRHDLAAIARETGAPFFGIWLEAPTPILVKRLGERLADASDATNDVLDLQVRTAEVPPDWHRLDTSGDLPVDALARQIESFSTRVRKNPHR
jgi:predicted kinase